MGVFLNKPSLSKPQICLHYVNLPIEPTGPKLKYTSFEATEMLCTKKCTPAICQKSLQALKEPEDAICHM